LPVLGPFKRAHGCDVLGRDVVRLPSGKIIAVIRETARASVPSVCPECPGNHFAFLPLGSMPLNPQ